MIQFELERVESAVRGWGLKQVWRESVGDHELPQHRKKGVTQNLFAILVALAC